MKKYEPKTLADIAERTLHTDVKPDVVRLQDQFIEQVAIGKGIPLRFLTAQDPRVDAGEVQSNVVQGGLMKSVVKEWVGELSFRQQTVLLSAIRGCDGLPKEDLSKVLSRTLRGVVLNDGCPHGTPCDFMRPCDLYAVVPIFMKLLDHYPVHWLMHFAHAAEVVGYHHPINEERERWFYTYSMIVHALHLNIETVGEMDRRLA